MEDRTAAAATAPADPAAAAATAAVATAPVPDAPIPTDTVPPQPTAAVPAPVVPAPTAPPAPDGVPGGRERIDAIDAELIALIRRRMAVSAEIQAARMSDGGRRLDLRRETEVIGRYTRELGRPGTSVAMALLELGRGRV